MSDNINSIIAQPIGINPVVSMAQWQQLAQSRADTQLRQQQVQGAQLSNQLSALQLGRTNYLYGLAGIPNASGGPSSTASALASGSGAPASGALPGAGGAAQGGAAPSAQGAPAAQNYPGQAGMDHLGVPLPPLVAGSVLTAQDPATALKTANEARRQAVFSAVSSAAPDQYPQAMQGLYRAGWVTPQMLQDAMAHPEGRARILQATQSPESYQSAQTAFSGQGLQINSQTGQPEVSPAALSAAGGKAQASAAGTSQGEAPLAGLLAQQRAAGTSQGNLPLAGDIAKAQALGKAAADTTVVNIPTGKKDANGNMIYEPHTVSQLQAIAMANGANGSQGDTSALGSLGGPIPTGGLPNGSPAGLVPASPTLASGQARSPLAAIAPNLQPPQPAAAPSAVTPPATPPSPSPPTGLPGFVSGPPVLSPQQSAALDVQKNAAITQNAATIGQMKDYQTAATSAAAAATSSNTLIDQMRVAGQGFEHGAFADTYGNLQKTFGSIGQIFGGKIDPSVSSWEEFNKDAGQLAQAASSKLSPQVGVGELQLVQKYLPSATMSAQAFGRIADQIQGINDFQIAKNQAASVASGNPSQFEAAFNKNVTPGAFIVHRMSADDAATFAQALNKTEEGRATLKRIISGMNYASQNGLFPAAGSN